MPDQDRDIDWETRYQLEATPWDLGEVAPPFVDAFERGLVPPGRLAIPGAGLGHEAVFFARRGFAVTAFDIAPSACRALEERSRALGLTIDVVCGDVFAASSRYDGAFDAVLEQTFFCAILPERRADYVRLVQRLLKPNGLLFGVFFDIDDEDGPPFGTDSEELRRLFEPAFDLVTLERCRTSHPRRRGQELWLMARRK